MSSVCETVRRSEVRGLSRGEIFGPLISHAVGYDLYPEASREPGKVFEQLSVVTQTKLGHLTLEKTSGWC